MPKQNRVIIQHSNTKKQHIQLEIWNQHQLKTPKWKVNTRKFTLHHKARSQHYSTC